MSLTKEDLQNIKFLIQETVEEVFDRKFDEKFDEAFDRKFPVAFNDAFDERLGRNLEKVQKMIDESLAEQTALLFKHFATKQDLEGMGERYELFSKRVVNLEAIVADHSYKLDVDPVPKMKMDIDSFKVEEKGR